MIDISSRGWRAALACTIALAAIVMFTGTASAEVETQAQTVARGNVEAMAAKLPAAQNETQALRYQQILAPAVKEALAAGAGLSVIEATHNNPSVAADVARLGGGKREHEPKSTKKRPGPSPNGTGGPAPTGTVEAKAGTARFRGLAHSAGCWGSTWNQQVWSVPGGDIAWIYVRENGWCGDGYAMTWLGGATFADWEWGPYCIAGHGTDYSWDGYPSWVHMANWGELGVSYVWGCLGINGEKVTIRIAANGYYDYYNDYGF